MLAFETDSGIEPPEEVQKHGGVEQESCELAVPVGRQHKLAALQYQQAHHAAGYLLYEKEREQDDE